MSVTVDRMLTVSLGMAHVSMPWDKLNMKAERMKHPQMEKVIEVIRRLRDPQKGCPWDLEQSHESLLRYLVEEAYEYIEAVESGNAHHMCEELGDVLLQVLLHATIAEQEGRFNLEDVAKGLADKMIRRHPHVFGEDPIPGLTPEQVRGRWEKLKTEEKKSKGPVSHIPSKLLHNPALRTAQLIGLASGKVAFDWENHQQVMYKVEEEWQELKDELPPGGRFDQGRVAEELGDMLFSLAQLARHLGVDPEEALRDANKKFLRRFHSLEKRAIAKGLKLPGASADEMEKLWVEVKKDEA